MTGWTSPDQLPYPDSYNDPADVPAAVEALAQATQAALDTKPDADGVTASLNTKAPLASPTLTGTPKAPTPATATSTTQIATSAQVHAVANAKVVNALGTGTSVAPSQNAVNTGLAGKSDTSHTHSYTPAQVGVVGRVLSNEHTLNDGATGSYVVAHGLGRSPAAVIAQAYADTGAQSIVMSVASWDGTNVTVLARNVGGAAETFRIITLAV